MRVSVRLFAGLRERAGTGELELELPERATVADALARLDPLADGLPLVLAVNREYADRARVLEPGDELAAIPPVSGGGAQLHAAIVDGPLSLDAVAERVRDPRAGAIVTFSGVTRDVGHLDYEAYAEMAGPLLASIVAAAAERHGLTGCACEHRTGRVALGEPSVVVAASAPHRGEAFAGAREVIDELKERLPVWKREEGAWVPGSAPSP